MLAKKHVSGLGIFTLLMLCFWNLPTYGQKAAAANTNKKAISKYFNEGVNNHNLTHMREFFASDYIWHQMNGIDVRSSQDTAHFSTLRWLFTAVPDIHYAIDHVIAEGDIVAVNTTGTGTAKSEMFGLPPALKKVRFKQMFFFRLKNNKITEEWEAVDLAGLNDQLKKE